MILPENWKDLNGDQKLEFLLGAIQRLESSSQQAQARLVEGLDALQKEIQELRTKVQVSDPLIED